MSKPCDSIDHCEFFRDYCLGCEELKAEWVRLFCGCMATAALCQRKNFRLSTGENPPVNMAPTGHLL